MFEAVANFKQHPNSYLSIVSANSHSIFSILVHNNHFFFYS